MSESMRFLRLSTLMLEQGPFNLAPRGENDDFWIFHQNFIHGFYDLSTSLQMSLEA